MRRLPCCSCWRSRTRLSLFSNQQTMVDVGACCCFDYYEAAIIEDLAFQHRADGLLGVSHRRRQLPVARVRPQKRRCSEPDKNTGRIGDEYRIFTPPQWLWPAWQALHGIKRIGAGAGIRFGSSELMPPPRQKATVVYKIHREFREKTQEVIKPSTRFLPFPRSVRYGARAPAGRSHYRC